MMYGYYEPNAWWMWGAMALTTLFWLALIGAIIWGIVRLTSRRGGSPTQASPLTSEEIVRQRFARGEIDAQTYELMLARLGSGGHTQAPATPRA